MNKILKFRATQNKIIPQDWKCITAAIFEADLQLKWWIWWKEETRSVEQWNTTRDMNISEDEFLYEGLWVELQRQIDLEDHTLLLCLLAVWTAWDNDEEQGNRYSHLLKVYKDQIKDSLIFAKIDFSCTTSRNQKNINQIFGFWTC